MPDTACPRALGEHQSPGGGSRYVFRQFAWLEIGPGKVVSPRPARLSSTVETRRRVTQTVRCSNVKYEASIVNLITRKQEIILKKPVEAKRQSLRFVLPLLVIMFLIACDARIIEYKGTCAQQTQQFLDYIHSLVIDELTPVIDDGFHSGPTADVIKSIEKLDARLSQLNTPECNTRTHAVKEALRLYMLEARNYFTVVAGRAVYGEGPVQGQLSKMYEAGWAFEIAFEELRR